MQNLQKPLLAKCLIEKHFKQFYLYLLKDKFHQNQDLIQKGMI